MIILDAEYLAEAGIMEAYTDLFPVLKRYVADPENIVEHQDDNLPSYAIEFRGKHYPIYGPKVEGDEGDSWGRATFAFFDLVNQQLEDVPQKFYAINAGNDLGGMFLTKEEYEAAVAAYPRKTDWPYLPKPDAPWYGQHH
jgi:hypothetical protein